MDSKQNINQDGSQDFEKCSNPTVDKAIKSGIPILEVIAKELQQSKENNISSWNRDWGRRR